MAGPENFYRGGDLKHYDEEIKTAIATLKDKQQSTLYTEIWQRAHASTWQHSPVWIHGDVASGNLLVKDGKLSAVIDFGQLAIGDPACDLALYWTFFTDESKAVFKKTINLDANTWARARGWVLWKTLCAPIAGTHCEKILKALTQDFD